MTRDYFLNLIPKKPSCTSLLGSRLMIRGAQKALDHTMIQINSPLAWRWLVFDIDGHDAFTRAEDRRCPVPTFISLNPSNGHAHAAYLLETPVSALANSSRKAMAFFEDVERGLTNRLGADRAYSGYLIKNPFSPAWVTVWQAQIPYRLDTLNDFLDYADKRKSIKNESSAIGRNVSVFDAIRMIAYKQCSTFKQNDRSHDDFTAMLQDAAKIVNCTFSTQLSLPELKGIVRSVSKWVWNKFGCVASHQFSATQRARVNIRWAKKHPSPVGKPWEAANMSRSAWYRLNPSADSSRPLGLIS